MTHELKDKIAVVAKYAGWEYESEETDGFYVIAEAFYFKVDEEGDTMRLDISDFTYNTSLDAIAPVAIKVMGELEDIMDETTIDPQYATLIASAATFDPIQIFNAVYSGITLLNQTK